MNLSFMQPLLRPAWLWWCLFLFGSLRIYDRPIFVPLFNFALGLVVAQGLLEAKQTALAWTYPNYRKKITIFSIVIAIIAGLGSTFYLATSASHGFNLFLLALCGFFFGYILETSYYTFIKLSSQKSVIAIVMLVLTVINIKSINNIFQSHALASGLLLFMLVVALFRIAFSKEQWRKDLFQWSFNLGSSFDSIAICEYEKRVLSSNNRTMEWRFSKNTSTFGWLRASFFENLGYLPLSRWLLTHLMVYWLYLWIFLNIALFQSEPLSYSFIVVIMLVYTWLTIWFSTGSYSRFWGFPISRKKLFKVNWYYSLIAITISCLLPLSFFILFSHLCVQYMVTVDHQFAQIKSHLIQGIPILFLFSCVGIWGKTQFSSNPKAINTFIGISTLATIGIVRSIKAEYITIGISLCIILAGLGLLYTVLKRHYIHHDLT